LPSGYFCERQNCPSVVVVQVVRGRREELDAHARMALDEAPVKGVAEPSVPS
jgi:hypothetical protein